jgi:hypothetical protein
MTKTTHTHRGTCQSCGSVQAVDNKTGMLAKHGYTIPFGTFQLICKGSDHHKPAEHDVTLCRFTMKGCLESAAANDAIIVRLRSGTEIPATFERWNRDKVKMIKTAWGDRKSTGDYDTLPIFQATPEERRDRVNSQIRYHQLQVDGLRAHEGYLRTMVLPRYGQELYAAADLNRPKAVAPPVVVDTKKAQVVGTFTTKQARKDALDQLNHAFGKAYKAIMDVYLALPHDARTEAKTEVYYSPMQLSHWRPKHSAAALKEFPEVAALVTEIEDLIKTREAVKAAP